MTDEEVKAYKCAQERGDDIQLFGYTSTTLDKSQAIQFAWEKKDAIKADIKKVVFTIFWDQVGAHYYLNAGAFDDEQEVLLMDGVTLAVKDVSKVIN